MNCYYTIRIHIIIRIRIIRIRINLRLVDKNEKLLSPKKRDSPLSPGLKESVRLVPNNFRHHPKNGMVRFHYVPEKPKHHLKIEMVQFPQIDMVHDTLHKEIDWYTIL
jgi:hypothetical protein